LLLVRRVLRERTAGFLVVVCLRGEVRQVPGTAEQTDEQQVAPEIREVLTEEEISALLDFFEASPAHKGKEKK
jgi:hypothetical protein